MAAQTLNPKPAKITGIYHASLVYLRELCRQPGQIVRSIVMSGDGGLFGSDCTI